MGFMDRFKSKSGELRGRASGLAREHGGKIDQGLGKASDAANKRTKGKYDKQIRGASAKAREGVDRLAKDGRSGPTDPAGPTGTTGPTGPTRPKP
ncbi:MAG: antitoxin [Nocardioidaceae bacterium]